MKCKNYLLSLLENIPLWYEDVQPLLLLFIGILVITNIFFYKKIQYTKTKI